MVLSNYVENGKYYLIANATWLRFLHSCNSFGNSNVTYETFVNVDITGLAQHSEYNITVTVTNAVGSTKKSFLNVTQAAGMSLIKANFTNVFYTFFLSTLCTT